MRSCSQAHYQQPPLQNDERLLRGCGGRFLRLEVRARSACWPRPGHARAWQAACTWLSQLLGGHKKCSRPQKIPDTHELRKAASAWLARCAHVRLTAARGCIQRSPALSLRACAPPLTETSAQDERLFTGVLRAAFRGTTFCCSSVRARTCCCRWSPRPFTLPRRAPTLRLPRCSRAHCCWPCATLLLARRRSHSPPYACRSLYGGLLTSWPCPPAPAVSRRPAGGRSAPPPARSAACLCAVGPQPALGRPLLTPRSVPSRRAQDECI